MAPRVTPCVLLGALLLLSGCGEKPAPPPPPAPPRGTEEPFLLIGLIPETNVFKQIERYEPLADYLSRKVGLRIRLTVLTRYGNIIDNFVSGGMDGAFFGSFSYALAHRRLGVEVLARPVREDGVSTYHGVIFARRDSKIRSIEDMRGQRFAFVDRATTAGYLLPLAYFREHGRDYKTFLRETYFTGTHEDAILDVLNGKADLGAAKSTVFDRLAKTDPRVRDDLVILARSPEVPENALAVRRDLDAAVKARLRESLLRLHEDAEGASLLRRFGAERFIATTDNDYAAVYEYARECDLDLATYDYRNE